MRIKNSQMIINSYASEIGKVEEKLDVETQSDANIDISFSAKYMMEALKSFSTESVDIHFIGHLQTNKVRQIIDKVSMIHSVDSLRLAEEINRQAEKIEKTIDILIEVNIGEEESKSGVLVSDLEKLLTEIAKLPRIHVKGLMCIPPNSKNEEENAHYFAKMQKVFIDMKQKKNYATSLKKRVSIS